ncbi:MAG: shikimate kinase [Campylobacterota bacterium]|nr:shikimate kinase [Campylobacterota bacterium]
MVYDNIVLIGFMGCGKTSAGKILARQLQKKFMDVDVLIEKEQKCTVADIFEKDGEEHFRTLEKKCIDDLIQNTGQVISTGGGLPIHCNLSEKSLVIYVAADFDAILNRLSKKERDKRPLFNDENGARALFNERIDTYKELSMFSIDANQSIQVYMHVLVDYILDQRVL